jgi:hypothetical protein
VHGLDRELHRRVRPPGSGGEPSRDAGEGARAPERTA